MSVAPTPSEPAPTGPAVVVQGNVQGGVQYGPNGLQINNPKGAVVVDRRETRRVRRPVVVPPPAPDGFVGRVRELSQISVSLATHRAVVVVGAAGVGKSAILVLIASAQALSDFPEGIIRIAGIDRRGTGRSADDIAQCLYNAAYDADPVPKLTIETARAELAGLGVFVVLDDVALPADDQAEVAGLFQVGRTILSATRTTLDSTVEPVRLSALQRDESTSLLFGRAGVTASAGDPDLDRICALLADWPEALVIAANAIRDRALGPQDARLAIESTVTSSEEPVAAALERAFALAEPALTSDERRTLSTAASLPGGSVDPSMLRALLGNQDWVEPAIEHLRVLGLLFTNSPRLRVHPALLGLATAGFDDAPVQKAHVNALRTWLGRREPASEQVGDELDSVLGALDRAFEQGRWQDVIDLGRAIDPYVALRGLWDVWGRVINWVGEASRELGASADLAWSLHQAGSRALMVGDRAVAEKALIAALNLRERSGDTVGAAYTRHNLARLHGGPPLRERTPRSKPDGRHVPWARALWIAVVAAVIIGSARVIAGVFGDRGDFPPTSSVAPASAAGVTLSPVTPVPPLPPTPVVFDTLQIDGGIPTYEFGSDRGTWTGVLTLTPLGGQPDYRFDLNVGSQGSPAAAAFEVPGVGCDGVRVSGTAHSADGQARNVDYTLRPPECTGTAAPSAPIPTSPQEGDKIQTVCDEGAKVLLQWTPVEDAYGGPLYRVILESTDDNVNWSPVLDQMVDGTAQDVALGCHSYRWTVTAIDDLARQSAPSSEFRFRVRSPCYVECL